MIDEVLLEHVTPSLDNIQESLFKGLGVHTEPRVKDLCSLYFVHLGIKLFVRVDL